MNYREMARIAGDPAAVRAAVGFITTVLGDKLSGSEREFLSKLAVFEGPDPLTMRQREWLHALRGRGDAPFRGQRPSGQHADQEALGAAL